MTIQTYRTVLEEVQDASVQLSILKPSGVYDVPDENAQLMGSYVNLIGQMLLGMPKRWQQFRGTFDVTGNGILKSFDVPANYAKLTNNTGWSLANRRPCYLATESQWAYINAWVAQFTVYPVFRLIDNKFEFFTAPAPGEVIRFEYVKKGWVIDAADPNIIKQFATNNGDTPMFDSLLMTIAIKLKWREAKGFDTTMDSRDFQDRLAQVEDQDTPGQIISLVPGSNGPIPLIGPWNLPNTGYGQ